MLKKSLSVRFTYGATAEYLTTYCWSRFAQELFVDDESARELGWFSEARRASLDEYSREVARSRQWSNKTGN